MLNPIGFTLQGFLVLGGRRVIGTGEGLLRWGQETARSDLYLEAITNRLECV